MPSTNPLRLDNACGFEAWAVTEDGLRVTLIWECVPGTLRFHIADEPDAVHLLVTISAEPPTASPLPEHDGHALSGFHYERAELSLPSPLGDRQLVDASEGVVRPRLEFGANFPTSFWPGESRFDRAEPGTRRWSYDDDHRIIRFVPPPGHPDESRRVSLARLAGAPVNIEA